MNRVGLNPRRIPLVRSTPLKGVLGAERATPVVRSEAIRVCPPSAVAVRNLPGPRLRLPHRVEARLLLVGQGSVEGVERRTDGLARLIHRLEPRLDCIQAGSGGRGEGGRTGRFECVGSLCRSVLEPVECAALLRRGRDPLLDALDRWRRVSGGTLVADLCQPAALPKCGLLPGFVTQAIEALFLLVTQAGIESIQRRAH